MAANDNPDDRGIRGVCEMIKLWREALWLKEPFNKVIGFKFVITCGNWGLAVIRKRPSEYWLPVSNKEKE